MTLRGMAKQNELELYFAKWQEISWDDVDLTGGKEAITLLRIAVKMFCWLKWGIT